MNLKTLLGAIALCTIIGGWMVTASVTTDNRRVNEKQEEEIKEVSEYIMEQRTMNTQQYAINEKLVEILSRDGGVDG